MMECGAENRRPPPPRPPPLQRPTLSLEGTYVHTFHDVQRIHDSVYGYIDSGLKEDERGNGTQAKECYSEGLRLLNEALLIDCEKLCNSSSDKKDQAKQMQQKMLKTKQKITFRLQAIEADLTADSTTATSEAADAPPSYVEAMSETSRSTSLMMDPEFQSLGSSIMDSEPDSLDLTNAEHVFSIEAGVQIFYISAEGFVSAPSYPSALHIVRFHKDAETPGYNEEVSPPAFLHVGDWLYPLVPGTSPALQTNYGAYMFPDMMSQQPNAAVGLILPETLPPQVREQFEHIIRSFTVLEQQSVEPNAPVEPMEQVREPRESTRTRGSAEESEDTATKISKGILVAANWIAWGVGKGAEKAGQLIRSGSEKVKERIQPSAKEHKVDPRIQQGVIYVRQATHMTVQVTGYLVSKLGQATAALAKEIAPHVRKQGEKLIPKSFKTENESGKSKLDGVVEIAASGLQGFGQVYMGLETAAKTLGSNLADETVHIVNQKYGAEAGTLTHNTMYAAGNVTMTAFNANNFGVKAVAKRAVKDTGKAVMQDLSEKNAKKGGYNPCESDDDKVTHDIKNSTK